MGRFDMRNGVKVDVEVKPTAASTVESLSCSSRRNREGHLATPMERMRSSCSDGYGGHDDDEEDEETVDEEEEDLTITIWTSLIPTVNGSTRTGSSGSSSTGRVSCSAPQNEPKRRCQSSFLVVLTSTPLSSVVLPPVEGVSSVSPLSRSLGRPSAWGFRLALLLAVIAGAVLSLHRPWNSEEESSMTVAMSLVARTSSSNSSGTASTLDARGGSRLHSPSNADSRLSSNTVKKSSQTIDDNDDGYVYPPTLPSVAWLLTYLGSEYYSHGSSSHGVAESTLALVQRVTGTTTASNDALSRHRPRVPVHPDYSSGPFLTQPSSTVPLPKTFILTQTYCGSLVYACLEHCLPLRPDSDVALEFAQACTSGRVRVRSPYRHDHNHSTDSAEEIEEEVRSMAYDGRIPQRAVHVVHDPFGTVLNRMQLLAAQRRKRKQQLQSAAPNRPNDGAADAAAWNSSSSYYYPPTRHGTRRWCRYVDAARGLPNSLHQQHQSVLAAYASVPCASEWYQYIQWHNMVRQVIIPAKLGHLQNTHTLWVENYTASVESNTATVSQLLDFLHLNATAATVTAVGRRPIAKDATDDTAWHLATKRAAAVMMRELASNDTWALIRHYLEPYLTSDDKDDDDDYAMESNAPIESSSRDDPTMDSGDDDDDILAIIDDSLAHYEKYVATTPPEPDDSNPQVVWLLSFPNSGTSYTLMNIEQMANVTTGTNYAKDWASAQLIRPDSMEGPFFHKPLLRLPHNVLTKTHCYGYCDDCGPRVYEASTNDVFTQGCLRTELPSHGGDAHYKSSIPTKAVHLFRNPFDNIVARMHLAVKKREKSGWSPEQLSTFGNSKEGLNAWCGYLDAKYAAAEQAHFTTTVWNKYMQGLPCHADWYRYVMWHNHAFALTSRLNLPVHTLLYEDYTHRYDEAVTDLLDFMELTPRQPPVEFYIGKSYEHFFDDSHARKAATLVQALGSNETWARVRHYFEPYL